MSAHPFKPDTDLEPIDLSETYTLLHASGEVEKVVGGKRFWDTPRPVQDRIGQSWLLSEHHYLKDWDEWVMHPACDELFYLLSGSMDIILDTGTQNNVISLNANDLATIPRSVWHTIKLHSPCHVLNISRELDTKHRKKR